MSEESTAGPLRLGAVIHADFELLDLYGPLEMFGCLKPRVEIVTVAERKGPVASSAGPETVAQYDFDDCPPLDLVLLPGGIGTLAQLGNERILEFLRERGPAARVCMSVCSGSALLAKAGVLDGRRATSNKVYFQLATSQSDAVEWVPEARWVEDGPYFTSSGVSAGTDMSLAVIAGLFGDEIATTVSILTEYEWERDSERDPFVRYLNQVEALGALAPPTPA